MAPSIRVLDTLKSRWQEIEPQYEAVVSNNEVALLFRAIANAIADTPPDRIVDQVGDLPSQFPARLAPLCQDLVQSVLNN